MPKRPKPARRGIWLKLPPQHDQYIHAMYPSPSNNGATGHGAGQTCPTARGARNLWVWNFDFNTYNDRTLASESNIEVLYEELKDVKWNIIGRNEVRRTGEEFIELKNGDIFVAEGQ